MNKWKQHAVKIYQSLQNSKEYQTYLALETAAKEAGLFAWEERLKQMQKDITISLDEMDMDKHIALVAIYKLEKAAFESEPLHCNYIEAKRQLNDLLQEMMQILQF